MAGSKVLSAYLLVCFVALWESSWAKPVEFGKVSNGKLLQALAKQHGNSQPASKLDRALMLRELLYPTKSYQSGDNNEEARQMPAQESASQPYSPLELLQALADYEASEDYYQDQANADGLYYTDGQDGWFDGPVLPKVNADNADEATDEQLNKLLISYLYDHYNKANPNDNDEDEDSNVEKRRQKIVIKEDFAGLTTASTPVASTASSRKAKLLHKPGKVHHGQKEVPLLRPANAAETKQQKDWPEELEENNLDEEESLKEMRSQSRPVRDVLTSQLDGLKEEAQLKSGAASSAQSDSKQN